MAEKRDYYEVLEVTKESTVDVVRRSSLKALFRRLHLKLMWS